MQVSGLSKNYGSLRALDQFSLEVEKGQVWGILGPNGSGKTTALGILLGVTLASAGEARWFGEAPSAKLRRRIGAILEQPNFYPWLSAEQNLKIVATLRGSIGADEIEKKLRTVGLWERRADPFAKFSLGMKQRLAFASALLGEPEVLVLDEPTNGLDAQAIAEVRETILAVAKEGKTILMASHILAEVEKICSHVVILQKGKTLSRGTINQVLATGNSFEFSATAMDRAKEVVEKHASFRNLKPAGDRFLAEFESGVTAESFNQWMFEQGVVLSHLSRQNHGLETQFLKLLEQNRA